VSERPWRDALARAACAIFVLAFGVACNAGHDAIPPWLRPASASETAPRVVRIVCDAYGARALSPTVRARPDGVHLHILSRSGHRFFSLRGRTGSHEIGRLRGPGATEVVATIPPGALSVGCFASGPRPDDPRAGVEVVDAERLWRPPSLGCPAVDAGTFFAGLVDDIAAPDSGSPSSVSWTQIIRASVPGIRLTDLIIRPGYPLTEFHSEPRTVYRGRRAVAGVSVVSQHGRWSVRVRACPSSGIGFAPG
jgi:hypothetical protein